MKRLLQTIALVVGALFGATGANAVPIETFQLNSGLSSSTEGTVVVP
jgi:hypothetical protein